MILARPPKTETDKNNNCENINKISIIFEDMNEQSNEPTTPIIIEFLLGGKIFDLIQEYESKYNHYSFNKIFYFNNEILNPYHGQTLSKANLDDNCKISVFPK